MSDKSFPTAAIITASGAILVWVLTKIGELARDRRQRKNDTEKYVMALFAEIDFNTRDMEIFLEESASVDAVINKVKSDQKFIPHITDARHISIYSEGISNIHYIGKEQIGALVYFYGLLEKLKNQVAGIYLPSFVLISPEGRAATIREIIQTADEIESVGRTVLDRLKSSYKHLSLERTIRHKPTRGLTDAQLKTRAEILSSDLDRINTKHKRSPYNANENSILFLSTPDTTLLLISK